MAYATSRVTDVLSLGVDLVPCPTTPGFKDVTWGGSNKTTLNSSPFTGQTQVLSWPGSDAWTAQVTLPSMGAYTAAKWTAWLQSLNGRVHAFQVGDQLYSQGAAFDPNNPNAPVFPSLLPLNVATAEQGAASFSLTVASVSTPGSYSISLTGAPESTARVLSAGDYIQVGYRLYRVTTDAGSDGNGNLTLSVWPSIREAHAAGATVDMTNPVGLFRLASDEVSWSYDYNRMVSLSFSIVEVR